MLRLFRFQGTLPSKDYLVFCLGWNLELSVNVYIGVKCFLL